MVDAINIGFAPKSQVEPCLRSTWNYNYDPIGNLVQDKNEKIDQILWTVTGKVSDVIFSTTKDDLTFRYDPMGNRIAKIQKPKNWTDEEEWTVTWYSRDAQGNVLAIYTKPENSTAFSATEFNIYGSSRIGLLTQPEELDESPPVPVAFSQILGNKVYEFSNHLGNVLTTFSDRKIATEGDPGYVDYYSAEILSSTDYYPFGFEMPERSYTGAQYRYGFQGQEGDPEIIGSENLWNYRFRLHDPRIGRFFVIDPLSKYFPFQSPYVFSSNRLIDMIELEGLQTHRPQVLYGHHYNVPFNSSYTYNVSRVRYSYTPPTTQTVQSQTVVLIQFRNSPSTTPSLQPQTTPNNNQGNLVHTLTQALGQVKKYYEMYKSASLAVTTITYNANAKSDLGKQNSIDYTLTFSDPNEQKDFEERQAKWEADYKTKLDVAIKQLGPPPIKPGINASSDEWGNYFAADKKYQNSIMMAESRIKIEMGKSPKEALLAFLQQSGSKNIEVNKTYSIPTIKQAPNP